MKRVVSLLLAVCLLAVSLPMAAMADSGEYTDTQGHWAEAAIERWSEAGVVQGYDGKFSPDANMTRGAFAVAITNLLGLTVEAPASTFTDLDPDRYYYDAVLKANAAGILAGYGNDRADPDGSITREQAFVMVARALGVAGDPNANADLARFRDGGDVSGWAKAAVGALVAGGYVNGTTASTMDPDNPINRASIMQVLNTTISTYITGPGEYEAGSSGFSVIKVTEENGEVVLRGDTAGVVVSQGSAGTEITIDGAEIPGGIKIDAPDVSLTISDSKVDGEVAITGTADNANIEVSAGTTVESLTTEAENVVIDGDGELKEVTVTGGDNVEVNTPGTAVTVEQSAAGATVLAGGAAVLAGSETVITAGTGTGYGKSISAGGGRTVEVTHYPTVAVVGNSLGSYPTWGNDPTSAYLERSFGVNLTWKSIRDSDDSYIDKVLNDLPAVVYTYHEDLIQALYEQGKLVCLENGAELGEVGGETVTLDWTENKTVGDDGIAMTETTLADDLDADIFKDLYMDDGKLYTLPDWSRTKATGGNYAWLVNEEIYQEVTTYNGSAMPLNTLDQVYAYIMKVKEMKKTQAGIDDYPAFVSGPNADVYTDALMTPMTKSYGIEKLIGNGCFTLYNGTIKLALEDSRYAEALKTANKWATTGAFTQPDVGVEPFSPDYSDAFYDYLATAENKPAIVWTDFSKDESNRFRNEAMNDANPATYNVLGTEGSHGANLLPPAENAGVAVSTTYGETNQKNGWAMLAITTACPVEDIQAIYNLFSYMLSKEGTAVMYLGPAASDNIWSEAKFSSLSALWDDVDGKGNPKLVDGLHYKDLTAAVITPTGANQWDLLHQADHYDDFKFTLNNKEDVENRDWTAYIQGNYLSYGGADGATFLQGQKFMAMELKGVAEVRYWDSYGEGDTAPGYLSYFTDYVRDCMGLDNPDPNNENGLPSLLFNTTFPAGTVDNAIAVRLGNIQNAVYPDEWVENSVNGEENRGKKVADLIAVMQNLYDQNKSDYPVSGFADSFAAYANYAASLDFTTTIPN